MEDVDVMLVNELRRLQRVVEKRKKVLSAEPKNNKRVFNRRYVVDLDIAEPFEDAANEPLFPRTLQGSFVVDRDCEYFCCQEMSYTVTVTGTVDMPGVLPNVAAKVSVTPGSSVFSFFWEVRDTHSDRSWQNAPLPNLVMGNGKVGGLRLPQAAKLPAGTDVQLVVSPVGLTTVDFGVLTAINRIGVQVNFIGFEVL